MSIDVARVRAETLGCDRVLHLNAAGAALPARPVVDAVVGHLRLEEEIGGYEAAAVAAEPAERVYDAVAKLINCNRDEVAIVENATRAWDMAFYGIDWRRGDRILTSMAEYASNYIAYLQVARRHGVEVRAVGNDEHGQVDLVELERLLAEGARLVAVTHVPTNGGLVNPVAEIGAMARTAGTLFLLDACQSAGQLPLDVTELRCDFLSATGRKYLRGPRGTGFLYVRRAAMGDVEPPFADLHAARWVSADRYELRPDARRYENWECNLAAKIGLGVAVDYANALGTEAIWRRVTELADALRERLADVPGVVLRDLGEVRCGIVTFTMDGVDPRALRDDLREDGISVWFSETLSTRLDMEDRGLTSVARASVHYYNTHEELDRFCRALTARA